MRAVYDWLTLRDYEREKEHASEQIEQQISRGNTSAQLFASMERCDLDLMSIAADEAMARIERRMPA